MKIVLCGLCVLLVSASASAILWSEPVLLSELNGPLPQNKAFAPHLSGDGLTIYFTKTGTDGNSSLWRAGRNDTLESFGTPVSINELYVGRPIYDPWVSADGLRLYYNQHENSTLKDRIHMAVRTSVNDPWQDAMTFTAIHQDYVYDGWCGLSSDELTLYYGRCSGGNFSMWQATRVSIAEQFSSPMLVPELNIGSDSFAPYLMPNGLTIYFSAIEEGQTNWNLYSATRSDLSDPFGNVELLNLCTGTASEAYPYVTADSSFLYFSTPNGIWVSQQVPEPASMLLLALGAGVLRKRK